MIGPVKGKINKPVTLKGYAQNHEIPLVAIQFSCDEQENWTSCKVEEVDADRIVNWTYAFTPEASGLHRLFVRALNAKGAACAEPALVSILVEE